MSKYIGNYEIVDELGRGGMGVVYKAREESLQRFVAIKMLGNQLVGNESVALRFMREARAVADLNHPNLVQVFRVDRHEDQPYFVMEYVEGESLKRLIQREDKMQPLRALQILKEVATGLAAAHDKGVIHRDIKPENIMLTKYGGVKVVDFGIARVEEPGTRLTTTGLGLGTPSYLSPEVCLSQDVDQRSDIFSLGVVLFEMLTGDTPFKSDSPFELMTKVVEARVPDIKALNPNVDEGAKQILAKMIAKRPKLRYQNCNELISDIEDYQAGRVPRWAKNMPLETEPAERAASAEPDADEIDDDVPAVVESTDAVTTPIPGGGPAPATSGDTVALAPEPGGGRSGRLALAAVLLFVVAGSAVAGSWYLLSGSERPVLAMFDSTPDAVATTSEDDDGAAETTSEGDDGADAAESVESPEADRAEDDSTPDQRLANVDARDTQGAAGDPADAVAASDEGAGFRIAVDEGNAESGSAVEAAGDAPNDEAIPVAGAESSGAAFEMEIETPTNAPRVAANAGDSGAGSALVKPVAKPAAVGDQALAHAMAETGESSGETVASVAPARSGSASVPRSEAASMPANPAVAVIAVGDPAVAGVVARQIKQALREASFDVLDEQMIEGLVYAESLAGVARTAQDAGASVLIYADVVPTGERELLYYGRQDLQYLASLEVRLVDLHSGRNLGPASAENIEYVALTAERKARRAAVPVARNVVNRLRAWRVMRSGSDQG